MHLVQEFHMNYRLSFACGYCSFISVVTESVYGEENTQGKGGGNILMTIDYNSSLLTNNNNVHILTMISAWIQEKK